MPKSLDVRARPTAHGDACLAEIALAAAIGAGIGFAAAAIQAGINGASFGEALKAGALGAAIGAVTGIGLGIAGAAVEAVHSSALSLVYHAARRLWRLLDRAEFPERAAGVRGHRRGELCVWSVRAGRGGLPHARTGTAVQQFRELGTLRFGARYFGEYVSGRVWGLGYFRAYNNISLEKSAFALGRRIENDLGSRGY